MPAFREDSVAEITAALGALPTGTPVSEVARRLMALFTGGSLAPGTRLPPERQLSLTLGVGRSAVREALAALEILGIVDVRPGSGTYLRGTASELLPDTLRWGLLIGEQDTRKLLQLRSGLEIFVARLAAERGGDTQPIADALAKMGVARGNLKTFAPADRQFHDAVAKVADNDLIVDLLQTARSLLRVYADRAVTDEREAMLAIEEHEAVYRAIVDGDPDAAASAMAVHMATASARLAAADASPL